MADLADPEATLGYAVQVAPISVEFQDLSVGTLGNPISLADLELVLNRNLLNTGLCLSSFDEDVLDSFLARQSVRLARETAEIVGMDVCAAAPGLEFSPNGLGGEIQVWC